MKYLVVECHLSYAVVLNENGRFIKVANMNYQAGQIVTDIIEMETPQPEVKRKRWIYGISSVAACMLLVVTAMFGMTLQKPYASVYMSINPEIRIDINKKNEVVDVEGINDDGEELVDDYNYRGKQLLVVMNEMLVRAKGMRYIAEDASVTLTLETDGENWSASSVEELDPHLHNELSINTQVVIKVESTGVNENNMSDSQNNADYGEQATQTVRTQNDNTDPNDYSDTEYRPENSAINATVNTTKKTITTTTVKTSRPKDSNYNGSDYEPTSDYDNDYDDDGRSDY